MGFLPSLSMARLAWSNLFRRKSRTALALLGIVIGVTAILGLVGVVDGLFGSFNDLLTQLQGVVVQEKDAPDTVFSHLKASVAARLARVPEVRTVVPEIWYLPRTLNGRRGGVEGGFNAFSTAVYGVDTRAFARLRGTGWVGDIARGRMLKPGEKGGAVVGRTLANDLHLFPGAVLQVDGKRFIVRGVTESESELVGGLIVVDLEEARELAGLEDDEVSSFFVELYDPSRDRQAAQKINFVLAGEGEALTTNDFASEFDSVLGNFRLAVFLVAALAALVAGVGIANTMLMSVLERAPEIGTLQATGWTRGNVMTLVLLESLFLGVLGGAIGLAAGAGLAAAAGPLLGVRVALSPALLAQAFLFALAVGLAAGAYPAWRAASLNPIEAVHHG